MSCSVMTDMIEGAVASVWERFEAVTTVVSNSSSVMSAYAGSSFVSWADAGKLDKHPIHNSNILLTVSRTSPPLEKTICRYGSCREALDGGSVLDGHLGIDRT